MPQKGKCISIVPHEKSFYAPICRYCRLIGLSWALVILMAVNYSVEFTLSIALTVVRSQEQTANSPKKSISSHGVELLPWHHSCFASASQPCPGKYRAVDCDVMAVSRRRWLKGLFSLRDIFLLRSWVVSMIGNDGKVLMQLAPSMSCCMDKTFRVEYLRGCLFPIAQIFCFQVICSKCCTCMVYLSYFCALLSHGFTLITCMAVGASQLCFFPHCVAQVVQLVCCSCLVS